MASKITNSEVAALFYEMASLLEISKENFFRVRAYQKAAQIIEGLTHEAVSLPEEELLLIRGIGKGMAAHISAINVSGVFPELEALRKKFPPGILDVLKVQGIGANRARLLYEKLGVSSLRELEEKARKGEVAALAGLGPKVQENILASLAGIAVSGPERALYWHAMELAEGLIKDLSALGLERPAYAGSLRRGKETVGDIDLLAVGRADGSATERFSKLPQIGKILALGPAKASVLLTSGIQCDLRIVDDKIYGAALNYFTGSKEHNVLLRELAIKKGFTLSEYGLCRLNDKDHKHPLASRTEEDIYEALGLQYVPPELREGRGEVELAAKKRLPELVTLGDIKGDAHNHTDLSDGTASMAEMLAGAAKRGFKWYFVGDHSVPLGVAHGLDFKEYKASRKELAALTARFTQLKTGRSIEMEILKDGSTGFTEKELAETDLVIGSIHSSFKMPETEMTARLIKAMRSPYLDVVAHPSGRLIAKRDPIALDYEKVFEAAAECGTAFEINGQPDRQDLTDVMARTAKERGIKILLSTDAHAAGQLDYMRMAVIVARRAGLTKKDVLNAMTFEEFNAWIARRRKRKN